MKKQKMDPGLLAQRALTVDELGPLVPRPVAAKFGYVTPMTLKNYEWPKGPLHPIRRSSRSVSYRKEEVLAFFGLTEPAPRQVPEASGPAVAKRPARNVPRT
jgi:hypothetical protein